MSDYLESNFRKLLSDSLDNILIGAFVVYNQGRDAHPEHIKTRKKRIALRAGVDLNSKNTPTWYNLDCLLRETMREVQDILDGKDPNEGTNNDHSI